MEDNLKTKLFILLVNYNGYLDTIECLESILKTDATNYQVIIIDNSDSNHYFEQLESWSNGNLRADTETLFPEIIFPLSEKPLATTYINEANFLNHKIEERLLFVKAKTNKGFAAANNMGLKYINNFGGEGDIIWLLNNDTIIADDTIENLLNELNNHQGDKDLTLFGTPLVEYYHPKRIQAIGGAFNPLFALTSHLGEGLELDQNINTSKFKVDYPIGASMVVTNQFVKSVGLMNEDYFLFFEELDWALRLKEKGGKVNILNVLGVYHKQGRSTKTKTETKTGKSEFIDLLSIKNRLLVTRKFHKNYVVPVVIFMLTVTVSKRLLSGDFKRGFKILKLIVVQAFEK